MLNREAVRQRKALSRTSSNILLNSVQMGHNTHNFNQYHHINYNNHPSDCDLNTKLKDLKEESSQHSFSNIEVIQFVDYFACQFIISVDQTHTISVTVNVELIRKLCIVFNEFVNKSISQTHPHNNNGCKPKKKENRNISKNGINFSTIMHAFFPLKIVHILISCHLQC